MIRSLASTAVALALLAAAPASAADEIRMLAPTWLGFAPVHVANDLGYFKDLGRDVTYTFEDDRANVMAALARGGIEVDGPARFRPYDRYPRPADEVPPSGVPSETKGASAEKGEWLLPDAGVVAAARLEFGIG